MATSFSIVLAMTAVFLVTSPVGITACDNVPTMSIDEACTKATANFTTPRMEVCESTLRSGGTLPANANVADFTMAAAMVARNSYEASMGQVNETLENPALKMEERRAFDDCQGKYRDAHDSIERAINQIPGCYFASAPQELIDATTSLGVCGNDIMPYQSRPLYAMNLADQELTWLAYHLANMIIN